jgi:nitronate monooxygenase
MTFNDLLACLTAPIVQAPMAGSQNHRLASAVCEAGGLGSLPAAMWTAQDLQQELTALTQATQAPYNVNFFCHTSPEIDASKHLQWQQALAPYYKELGLTQNHDVSGPTRMPFSHEMADVLEVFQPPVVSFHFGLPAPELLLRVKAWGSLVMSSATTVAEAQWLEAHGADVVIAQGLEAGGHRGMFLTTDLTTQLSTFALVPQIVRAVKVPVISAGGIATAEGVRAAKTLGASGVQIGTSYLCSHEAITNALHRAVLQSPESKHTALTNLFSGRPARGIVNRMMRELGPMHNQAPAFPLATAAVTPLRAAAEAKGLHDFTPLWSGQNTSGVREVSASDITLDLVKAWQGVT